MARRFLLSIGWLLLLAAFFRWFDFTGLVPGLPLWSSIFLLAVIVTARLMRANERGRIVTWFACIAVIFAAHAAVPEVHLNGNDVHTVAFVRVLDTVIPFWILVRALMLTWQGRARLVAATALLTGLVLGLYLMVIVMPGQGFRGALAPPTATERQVATELERDVRRLSVNPHQRNHLFPLLLDSAASFLDSSFAAAGYTDTSLRYTAGNQRFRNLEVTVPGTVHPEEIVVIGAHYDAVEGAPGADDNASGIAAMLAVARALKGRRFARTLRLVAFTNEEPPYFDTDQMGSAEYARLAAARSDRIVAMISLETMGYYSEEPGSQHYPPPFSLIYPHRGNFIAFVGNLESRALVRRAIGTFRRSALFPSEGISAPALVPGIGWSDHASFWKHGWAAIMISDTAPFRNPHYHLPTDTADRLDYLRLARVVTGLDAVVADLAG